MLDLADLAAWREMVHADFLFSQRRKERKEFLRNAGLGGLARDINDPRARIFVLAKAQRTQSKRRHKSLIRMMFEVTKKTIMPYKTVFTAMLCKVNVLMPK